VKYNNLRESAENIEVELSEEEDGMDFD